VESWAVSLRGKGQWGGSNNGVPNIVAAARFSAGVAVPLKGLCAALSACSDGLVTTDAARVDADFNLPVSEQAASSEKHGQRTILVLASVPTREAEPAA
jgi:hypothetical protein